MYVFVPARHEYFYLLKEVLKHPTYKKKIKLVHRKVIGALPFNFFNTKMAKKKADVFKLS